MDDVRAQVLDLQTEIGELKMRVERIEQARDEYSEDEADDEAPNQ